MSMPISFPDWMPWWLQLLVVTAALLIALALAFMPFSVFGVKSRLETIEARLDEVQSELRNLSLRLPEPGREPYDSPAMLRASAQLREVPPREVLPREVLPREVLPRETGLREAPPRDPIRTAPIPPASWEAEPARESLSPTLRAAARVSEAARERAEPRLSRPK